MEKPLASISKVAEFLHEAQLVLQVSSSSVALSMKGQSVVATKLSLGDLLETFEEGVLAYFNRGIRPAPG